MIRASGLGEARWSCGTDETETSGPDLHGNGVLVYACVPKRTHGCSVLQRGCRDVTQWLVPTGGLALAQGVGSGFRTFSCSMYYCDGEVTKVLVQHTHGQGCVKWRMASTITVRPGPAVVLPENKIWLCCRLREVKPNRVQSAWPVARGGDGPPRAGFVR